VTAGNTERELTLEYLDEIGQAFNRQDVDAIAGYFEEDGVFLFPVGAEPWGRKLTGRDEIRDALARRFAVFKDMRWEVRDRWVCGDRAVSEFTVKGTSDGGETIDHHGCDLWHFRNGKIVTKDTFWKRVVRN